MSSSSSSTSSTIHKLQKEQELRCEVLSHESLIIKLISGSVELFGIELSVGKEYYFCNENFALFTWYGGEIEVQGTCSNIYVAVESNC